MSHHQLSLLAIFAHPDDEQLVSGAFARYVAEGARVALICATRGEEGEIAVGTSATKETLGEVRERELRMAMNDVGVSEIYFLDYRDSGMAGTEQNQNRANLHNAPLDEVTGKIVKIIRQTKPQVLLTFDPNGGYGHPDHIKIHQAAMAAFDRAGNPNCYPEQLTDGLVPYAPQKIYWSAFSREFFMEMAKQLEAAGIDLSQFGAFNPALRATPEEKITTRLDVSQFLEAKERAWTAHATQQNPNSPFAKVPREIIRQFRRFENYTLAESRVPAADGIEDDLFRGIR